MKQSATLMSRRRFLAISATALATPVRAQSRVWTGVGLGGAILVQLDGLEPAAWYRVTRRIIATVDYTERHFSLFRDSAVTRLNRDGYLAFPSTAFLDVCDLVGRIHQDTDGAFDPTVQALWLAARERRGFAAARQQVGWHRVSVGSDEIRLEPGTSLTFNGIAQGWCADRIANLLRKEGLKHVLIDMGEIVGIGGRGPDRPWLAAVQSPNGLDLDHIEICDRALATSSPLATILPDGQGHILSPTGQVPKWSTVSVSAQSAATADALSTAFCLMAEDAISNTMLKHPTARCEVLAT